MKSTDTSTNIKPEIDKDFESRLGNPFSVANSTEKTDYDLPIVKELFVLNNTHNPMFIRGIKVPKTELKKPPLPDTLLDPDIKTEIISKSNKIAVEIKDHFRDSVLPFIIGFESADSDLQSDVSEILDDNALSVLMDYRRMAKDILITHLTTYFSNHFNLHEDEVKKIVNKNLFGKNLGMKNVQSRADS